MNSDSHLDAEEARAFCAVTAGQASLSPPKRLALSDHAARCVQCRELIASFSNTPENGRRRRVLADIRALANSAQAEDEREEEELTAFASYLESYPEEHFSPGGTLPPKTSSRSRDWDPAPNDSRPAWWSLIFARPAAFVTAAAMIAITAVLVTDTIFDYAESRAVPEVAAADTPLLNDGPVVVTANGTLFVPSTLPDNLRTTIENIIQHHSFRLLKGGLGIMRGDAANSAGGRQKTAATVPPYPIDPPMGSVVEDQLPLLRWTSVSGATGYQIEIASAAGGEKILSGPLSATGTAWRANVPLERGRIYRWTVHSSGKVDPSVEKNFPASLKILGATDEALLQALRSAPKVSHLALAAAYSRFNLPAEAKRELQVLRNENPDSGLAAELLESAP